MTENDWRQRHGYCTRCTRRFNLAGRDFTLSDEDRNFCRDCRRIKAKGIPVYHPRPEIDTVLPIWTTNAHGVRVAANREALAEYNAMEETGTFEEAPAA